jgi:hypothetical protein
VDGDALPDDDNPYAAPKAPIGPAAFPGGGSGIPRATLVSRSWLARRFRVETPEGTFDVTYEGLGFGERVYVNGRKVASGGGILRWAPRFDFPIGSATASVEVRINIVVGRLIGFRLRLDGSVLYMEGSLGS